MIVEMDHPKIGKVKNINSPIKLSRTPLIIRSLAPKVGENRKTILADLGYSPEDIKKLRKKGIFR